MRFVPGLDAYDSLDHQGSRTASGGEEAGHRGA